MNKILSNTLFLILCFCFNSALFSQSIGINTDGSTPHGSAQLDIKSSTRGLLVPRMTSTQRNAIASPAKGLMVYDSTVNEFWYYNGISWGKIAGGSGSGWSLSGNNGTNPTTDFIGTTDNTNLNFKINGIQSGGLTTNGNINWGLRSGTGNTTGYSNIAIGTDALLNSSFASNIIAIGDSALFNNGLNANPAIFESLFNTAIGSKAMYSNTTGGWNTAIGYAALFTNNSGIRNVAIGQGALYANSSGGSNISIGYATLANNTVGIHNTAIGDEALGQNTIGSDNVAVGSKALRLNITGAENVAIGKNALFNQSYTNNSSYYSSGNTAIGYNSLLNNQPTSTSTGVQNTAIGHSSMKFNTDGYSNTAIGHSSLSGNIHGYSNTVVGYAAMSSNQSGNRNTAIGQGALYANSNGSNNVAVGYSALSSNSIAYNNTAIGFETLTFNSNADDNTAIGFQALHLQSFFTNGGWASENVAVGARALFSNQPTTISNGVQNTAVGTDAMRANTTGFQNTASGNSVMFNSVNGSSNTATGYAAMFSNISGSFNTAYGQGALYFLTSGQGNIAIGYGSGTASGSPAINNTISIGNNDILNGASNQAFIGNLSMNFIGGRVGWGTYSDARIKNNIIEDVKGLDFILKLKPVTYTISNSAILTLTGNKATPDFPGKNDNEKVRYSGFLAQDVEKAAIDAHYEFSGVGKPANPNQLYTLTYEQFVVPLVKAVQEQQSLIEKQQEQINLLIKRLELLEKK